MEISHQCDGDTLHLNLKLLRKPMHVLLSLLVCILALWYSFKKNIQCLSIRKSSTKYKVMLPNPFVFCGLDRFSGGLCNSPIIYPKLDKRKTEHNRLIENTCYQNGLLSGIKLEVRINTEKKRPKS